MALDQESESILEETKIPLQPREPVRSEEGPPAEEKPRHNYRTIAIVLGILFVGGFCLFSIIISGLLSYVAADSDGQKNWLAISDAFMQAMAGKDVDGAYALFSDRAKSDFRQSDLGRMTEGSFYALFDGYESLELESWEISYNFPAGTFAGLVYRVRYQDEYEGILQAVLEEDGDGWKLYWIEVTVPPDKVDEYVGLEISE